MTREQQIQSALELLAPELDRRDECERSINSALDIINLETDHGVIGTKRHKLALERFKKTLRKAEDARNKLLGPERAWTIEGNGEYLLPLPFEQWIAYCEQQLVSRRPRLGASRRTANRKYHAVYWARSLLHDWGHRASKPRREMGSTSCHPVWQARGQLILSWSASAPLFAHR